MKCHPALRQAITQPDRAQDRGCTEWDMQLSGSRKQGSGGDRLLSTQDLGHEEGTAECCDRVTLPQPRPLPTLSA